MPIGSEEHVVERIKGRLLTWTFGVAILLALAGLVAATGESLRRQEHRVPLTETLEPPLPLQHAEAPPTYHDPGVAAWPAP
jgi:hypothetical protein